MRNDGQHEVFNFDIEDSAFDFETETIGYVTSLKFIRKREGKPDDTVFIWLRTDWVLEVREALSLEATRVMHGKVGCISLSVATALEESGGKITAEINDMVERELKENFDTHQDNQSRVGRGKFHE